MKETSYTIRKRENGKYQSIIRQKTNGKWKQVESKGGFDKKIDAQQWANKKVSEWQSKVFNDYEFMTVGELKKIYLEDLKERVKESTYINAVYDLNAKELDDKVISKIKPIEYREFIKNNSYTKSRRMATFYRYLKDELRVNIDNPFKHVKYKQKEFKKNIEEEEFHEILSMIDDVDTKLICKIAYYSGLRISEIMGLEIGDIKNSSINVNKQFYTNIKKVTSPKSKNGIRVVPIPSHLNKSIKTYLKNKKYINLNQRIFEKHAGTIRNIMRESLKGTKYENISFHYFRHSYITRLVQNGLDLKTVAYLAGDKLDTIVNTYIHTTKDTYKVAEDFIQKFM